MANGFGLNSREDTQRDNLMLVKTWLETEFLEPWIMIIDNVDDEMAFFHEKCRNDKPPSQVLPSCPHGSLLFTSRTRNVAFDPASPSTPICVDFLTREEGLGLLRNRLGPDPPEAHLIELLSELDYIPLAVTQAISFILKRGKSVEQYLKRYRMDDNSKSRLLSHEFLDHGRREQTMESVARTWQISFEWIQKYHVKAAEILCLMDFYQHHGVPEKLLRCDNIDAFEFEDNVAVLQEFSLLDVNKSRSSYSTHRLIQVVMKLWLQQNGAAQLEKWALRAPELITLRFPPPDDAPSNDYWGDCQSLLPHADILLQRSFNIFKQKSDLEKAKLLVHTGRYTSWAIDNVRDVQRRFKRSFEIRESHLGPRDLDTLESMGFHFWFLVRLEQINPPDFDSQEAAAVGYALLKLRREVLGPRQPDTIDGMCDLAFFLAKEGEFEKSETLQREALKLSKEVNGPLHIYTVDCMEDLAEILYNMRRYGEAVELATAAMTTRKSMLGLEHRTVLSVRSNLALYLCRAGRVQEAIEMNRDVMRLKEKVLGRDHPNTLITATNLALSLAADERFKEALNVLDCALSTIKLSRRVYRPPTSAQDFIELKLEYENELATKQLKDSNIASNPSGGSGVAVR